MALIKTTRTISITSGKGGVGKSTITANMAVHLARKNQKVLILDGDLGMGNVDIMFGVRTARSLDQVLKGDVMLKDILVEVHPNVSLIPGGSGILELQNLNEFDKRYLLDQVNSLPQNFDYLLIDTAPGIDSNVLYLNSAAHEICVVITPEPASLADSYALIKVLNKYHRENRFSIICNQVRDEREGLILFQRLSDVASRFLFVSLDYKGSIPMDPRLRTATRSQQLILTTSPTSPSSKSLTAVYDKLCDYNEFALAKGGIQFFWQQLLGVA